MSNYQLNDPAARGKAILSGVIHIALFVSALEFAIHTSSCPCYVFVGMTVLAWIIVFCASEIQANSVRAAVAFSVSVAHMCALSLLMSDYSGNFLMAAFEESLITGVAASVAAITVIGTVLLVIIRIVGVPLVWSVREICE